LKKQLRKAVQFIISKNRHPIWVPPGHFYSPLPNIDESRARKDAIYKNAQEFLALDMSENQQLEKLAQFEKIYDQFPYITGDKQTRYKLVNDTFTPADAFALFAMISTTRPNRFIEVGSGMSSAVTLDTIEKLQLKTELTFIEPYPDVLKDSVRKEDFERFNLMQQDLQKVDTALFEKLEENDILFIDSTHVSRFGSDVNYIFFNILPRLKPGVIVHFHDINFHFEYPFDWIEEGRGWTEAYILRAFLMYNDHFKIEYFNSFMGHFHKERIRKSMPLALYNENTGCSIWMKKVK
jgi:hypothetical protein